MPGTVDQAWAQLADPFDALVRDFPRLAKTNHRNHLGTLGGGNHFIEICLDEDDAVWVMLHSGSRGVGNAIGTMFIALAREDAMKNDVHLPDRDLAYFERRLGALRRLRARGRVGAGVRAAEPRGDDEPRDRRAFARRSRSASRRTSRR